MTFNLQNFISENGISTVARFWCFLPLCPGAKLCHSLCIWNLDLLYCLWLTFYMTWVLMYQRTLWCTDFFSTVGGHCKKPLSKYIFWYVPCKGGDITSSGALDTEPLLWQVKHRQSSTKVCVWFRIKHILMLAWKFQSVINLGVWVTTFPVFENFFLISLKHKQCWVFVCHFLCVYVRVQMMEHRRQLDCAGKA